MNEKISPTDTETVNRLASLNPLEYDRGRKEAAVNLDVSVSALDEAVKQARRETTETATKGRSINFHEPDPWSTPIDGSIALTEAANHILRHMRINEADAYACALWAAYTYMFEDFDHSPRLCITAHTEESGKTVLMSHLVGNLSNKPLSVELMKPAPFFRLAEEHKPTFLIDECDVFIRDDMELAAALNNGWEPHGGVSRCVGDDNEVRIFSTFTPTAMAGIELHKKLPATTLGRSILITLERALENEIEVIFNRKIHQQGVQETARKLARFISDNRATIKGCIPTLPEGVRNRLADKWTPMFAIAEAAGGNWPERARKALYGQSDLSEPTKALELLQDVQKVMPPGGHIFTETLIDKLCDLDDAPWAEYNFKEWDTSKKRISSRQVANLLGKYGLKPTTVKVSGIPRKGYKSDDLNLVFKRYIPVPLVPPATTVTPLPTSNNAPLNESVAVTPKNKVTDGMPLQPFKNGRGNGVTGKLGASLEKERYVFDGD